MLEQAVQQVGIGGVGCEYCMYWSEYGPVNLELHSFVGRWGRCSNLKATHDLNVKTLKTDTSVSDRTKTHITRLGIDSVILSTCPTYKCSNMRIPSDTVDSDMETDEHDE